MADSAIVHGLAAGVTKDSPRHPATVRITHWIAALCIFALLLSGIEILISHPRFYWGETGNVHMRPLFTIPIPASRASVPTGYNFVLPDQNLWSRSLHFQAAWLFVIAGFVYVVHGLATRHFERSLLPRLSDFSVHALLTTLAEHFRFREGGEDRSYNLLQRLSYLGVVFCLTPLMIWTGLAMSPGFVSAFPFTVEAFGGQQSARTIHFVVTVLLVLFVLVHLMMVWRAGFVKRTRAMITGRTTQGGDA